MSWPGWDKYVPNGLISDTGRVSRQTATAAKGSKYRNVKTTVDGITFDSAKEARVYGQLKIAEKVGAIRGLTLQPVFKLQVGRVNCGVYRADFSYEKLVGDEWKPIVMDVKGVLTPVYRLKKRLMLAIHNIEIQEV
jgi:hypothetical protein